MSDVKNLLQTAERGMDDRSLMKKLEEVIKDHSKELKHKNKDEYEDFYWMIYEKLNGKHFNEELVGMAIAEMEFASPEYRPNLTKEQIKNAIEQAYKIAEQSYMKKGVIAPKIPDNLTECDMEYTYYMVCADYPMSHMGDVTKISLMAYEFLSDPDAPEGKPYLYYCAMED